jgi:hypothetical protein
MNVGPSRLVAYSEVVSVALSSLELFSSADTYATLDRVPASESKGDMLEILFWTSSHGQIAHWMLPRQRLTS